MSYESETTRLRREINGKTDAEYQDFKAERQESWQNFSLTSNFFGVNFIVLLPFVLFILPFETFKSTNFVIFLLVFGGIVIYLERKYGSLTAFKNRLGLWFTKYKLNRIRRFGGVRFY